MELAELLENEYKVYVDVFIKHHSDGRIIPFAFTWEDGTSYKINKVIEMLPAASLKAGGTGMRYTVKVGTKLTNIWLEEDNEVQRWFMEKKEL